jgi:subtilase family serine protease
MGLGHAQMEDGMRLTLTRGAVAVLLAALGLAAIVALTLAGHAGASAPASTTTTGAIVPAVSDFTQVSRNETPPTQAQCAIANRRCFNPHSTRAAYNLGGLIAAGKDGRGKTIAVVDSYGSDTMAHDLAVYDKAWGLPAMCGEEGYTTNCDASSPKFSVLHVQGSPATKAPPSNNGTGQEDKSAWALEVALDVEAAHAMAPGANILLVATPTAETLGVQGLSQMMNAEQYVIDHHLADVISQSFGTGEEAFGSQQSLLNLRHAFVSAQQQHVTVLASSGDGGTSNSYKEPVKNPREIPFPSVGWPASDPLVTGVGGTYLCTNPNATDLMPRALTTGPPPECAPATAAQPEIGWIGSGGGFSHVFSRPSYQDVLPAGSTAIPASQRGVPDIALQASSHTGQLVYLTLPPDGNSGLICDRATGTPCSTGWYDIGGTSLSSPEWAGLVAIADQIHGSNLGLINPKLYSLASNPVTYAGDFFDVTTGNNTDSPDVPGYPATTGWDPVTGLGTPNAANLLPALAG